jgi:predicted RND superfamily exporter protein
LFLGTFHHLAVNNVHAKGKCFSQAPHARLASFAEDILVRLSMHEPGTIVTGMVRVDLMIHNDRIVVNEFESLEAMYSVSSDRSSALTDEYETLEFLKTYLETNPYSNINNEIETLTDHFKNNDIKKDLISKIPDIVKFINDLRTKISKSSGFTSGSLVFKVSSNITDKDIKDNNYYIQYSKFYNNIAQYKNRINEKIKNTDILTKINTSKINNIIDFIDGIKKIIEYLDKDILPLQSKIDINDSKIIKNKIDNKIDEIITKNKAKAFFQTKSKINFFFSLHTYV